LGSSLPLVLSLLNGINCCLSTQPSTFLYFLLTRGQSGSHGHRQDDGGGCIMNLMHLLCSSARHPKQEALPASSASVRLLSNAFSWSATSAPPAAPPSSAPFGVFHNGWRRWPPCWARWECLSWWPPGMLLLMVPRASCPQAGHHRLAGLGTSIALGQD
jgi:hypothetical protein